MAFELIGEWGNVPNHATPRNGSKAAKQNLLLRECPGCGRDKLKYRQRFCDDCKKKRRLKTKREYQRNFRRNYRVST